MAGFFAQADSALRRLPDWVLFVICMALVVGVAAFKVTIGHDVPMADFILVPVAGMAWLARSSRYAYLAALLAAALTVLMAEMGRASAPLGAALGAGFVRLLLYLVVIAFVQAMRTLQAERDAEASTDHLSGAANARAFRVSAGQEISRLRRYGRPVSLLYLDVDDFKAVNDRFGHAAGDSLLATVGHVLRCTVRSNDIVARLGGDEFTVLMPETAQLAAVGVARRLRDELRRVTLPDGDVLRFSIGVAAFVKAPSSVDAMIREADALMYRAKDQGKDRIESREVGAAL